jgi:hypothetical protein
MDQCTICLYLDKNGLSVQAIHDKLVQVFGSDAIAYSTVTSYRIYILYQHGLSDFVYRDEFSTRKEQKFEQYDSFGNWMEILRKTKAYLWKILLAI